MSDRGARGAALEERAPEVNESIAAEAAVEEVTQMVDVPALAPAELVAAVLEADVPNTPTTGRGFETAETERVAAERRELAEQIGQSQALPPGLRTRLAEVAQAGGSVADVVRAVEESLPGVLRLGTSGATAKEHPAGEAFFRGDADAVSEEQAEALARGQLARSGMLRGQRVRVAAD
jgi:predicted NUDIX family NTP pyrophosphohydrolase